MRLYLFSAKWKKQRKKGAGLGNDMEMVYLKEEVFVF